MTTLAWYWEGLLALGWVVTCFVLVVWWIEARHWLPGAMLALVFLGAPGWLVAYSWLDDDAPKSRCEALGGIVVVTPAQGRACIDRDAVIPESEWMD